jgi:beta-N-acetylhexosaminidase
VAALAAGVDLVCLGNPAFPTEYDDEAALEEVVGAIASAVGDGSLPEARLREASARVAALAAAGAGPRPGPDAGRRQQVELGCEIARRALTITGDVRLAGDALVLTPRAALGYAAGQRPSELVAELRRRRPRWQVRAVSEPGEAASAAAEAAGGVLLVVEGHAVDRGLVDAVLAAAPEAVVVYGGLPRAEDSGARTLHTHGTGAASAVAGADALLGEAPLR